MKLGIGSYTYAWAIGVLGHPPDRPMGTVDLLNRAAELDVQVVQVADNLPLDQLTTAELDAFEKRAIELSKGQHLMIKVLYAKSVGIQTGDREMFERILGEVGAGHLIAEIQQHLGDAAHAGAADTDQVHALDAAHELTGVHAATARQFSATLRVASGRASPRAAHAMLSSCARST